MKRLWIIRRPICWIRGHQHDRLNRAGTALIMTSFCQRCYHSPKRPVTRIWWSS